MNRQSVITSYIAVLLFLANMLTPCYASPPDPTTERHVEYTLEGNWKPYDFTTLKVKRTIQITHGGTTTDTEVLTPVLTRRGAVALGKQEVEELLAIKSELDKLKEQTDQLKKASAALRLRYSSLMEAAYSQVPIAKKVDAANQNSARP